MIPFLSMVSARSLKPIYVSQFFCFINLFFPVFVACAVSSLFSLVFYPFFLVRYILLYKWGSPFLFVAHIKHVKKYLSNNSSCSSYFSDYFYHLQKNFRASTPLNLSAVPLHVSEIQLEYFKPASTSHRSIRF